MIPAFEKKFNVEFWDKPIHVCTCEEYEKEIGWPKGTILAMEKHAKMIVQMLLKQISSNKDTP
jgi:hypothetical protein